MLAGLVVCWGAVCGRDLWWWCGLGLTGGGSIRGFGGRDWRAQGGRHGVFANAFGVVKQICIRYVAPIRGIRCRGRGKNLFADVGETSHVCGDGLVEGIGCFAELEDVDVVCLVDFHCAGDF